MRRLVSKSAWCALVFLILAGKFAFSQSASPQNQFAFTYTVRVPSIPQSANDIKIWIPLAKSDEHQEILNLQIESPYPYKVYEDKDYGNKILHLSFDKVPAENLELTIRYDVAVHGDQTNYEVLKKEHPAVSQLRKEEEKFRLYLASQSLLVINDQVRQIVREITQGKQTDLDKAKAIYDYVIAHMVYDKSGTGWGRGSTVHACEVGRGNCTDFHSLFISLCRASGIPARFKIGAQIPSGQSEGTLGYHCWAEFYLPEAGWIPVDTSEAWKHPELRDFYFGSHDPGKFFISLGRDIALQPLQKGDPVNIFLDPYIEIDGKPFGSVKPQFFFRKMN